jgi:hypothetical protein
VLDDILAVIFETAARTAHEVNRAYCQSIGDDSQPSWEAAPEWQQNSARIGVRAIADGSVGAPEQSHESWMQHKLDEGWKYGPVKDPEKKEHPAMVPYDQLPPEQRVKDALYFAVVTGILGLHAPIQTDDGEPTISEYEKQS